MSNKPTQTPHPEPAPAPHPASIVQPIIDDLKGRSSPPQVPTENEAEPPVGPIHPPKPAELAQDPGGGYNANHTFPQT